MGGSHTWSLLILIPCHNWSHLVAPDPDSMPHLVTPGHTWSLLILMPHLVTPGRSWSLLILIPCHACSHLATPGHTRYYSYSHLGLPPLVMAGLMRSKVTPGHTLPATLSLFGHIWSLLVTPELCRSLGLLPWPRRTAPWPCASTRWWSTPRICAGRSSMVGGAGRWAEFGGWGREGMPGAVHQLWRHNHACSHQPLAHACLLLPASHACYCHACMQSVCPDWHLTWPHGCLLLPAMQARCLSRSAAGMARLSSSSCPRCPRRASAGRGWTPSLWCWMTAAISAA